VVGTRLVTLGRSDAERDVRRTGNLVSNAVRIVSTLGELKGAAMKVGQMLSLHDTILPPEVAAVLRTLQKQAPRIPFEVVQEELETQLPEFGRIFASIEPEAFAAASIGQVHRGVLRDGRRVAVKVQYPLIDRIVEADLANLRRVLQALFALVTDLDFKPVWGELRSRLREELDYLHEADNMRRMAALHAEVPEIVIPRVVDEATTRAVLTMEYVEGIPPDEACSDRYDQGLKDRWGVVLFDFFLRGLLDHRFLHADPNLANFAFKADGRVVVYDFGCVKEVPARLARGYRDVCRAALAGRREQVPAALAAMGLDLDGGEPLGASLIDPYLDLVLDLLREAGPYRFGEDDRIYRRFLELAWANLGSASEIRFPHDIVFVNRTVVGHFGNLSRLKAAGPWRQHLAQFVHRADRARRPAIS
jgi:predicted unusual protein kinase regulating ubiquinone biosynthesis (AarF/ABC1/UbiB family)